MSSLIWLLAGAGAGAAAGGAFGGKGGAGGKPSAPVIPPPTKFTPPPTVGKGVSEDKSASALIKKRKKTLATSQSLIDEPETKTMSLGA